MSPKERSQRRILARYARTLEKVYDKGISPFPGPNCISVFCPNLMPDINTAIEELVKLRKLDHERISATARIDISK